MVPPWVEVASVYLGKWEIWSVENFIQVDYCVEDSDHVEEGCEETNSHLSSDGQ